MFAKEKTFKTYLGILLAGLLVGLTLRWFGYLDLYSFIPDIVGLRGWNFFYVFIPPLAAVGMAWYATLSSTPKKSLWAGLIFGVLSLAAIVYLWNVSSKDSLILSGPSIGFWVTSLFEVGLVGLILGTLFAKDTWVNWEPSS